MTDFAAFWQAQCALAAAPRSVVVSPERFANPMAQYQTLAFPATDGQTLRARYICPAGVDKAPTLLLFHDYTCPVRGWHHMTRYIAAGYAVLAPENRLNLGTIDRGWQAAPQGLAYAQLYADALTAAHVALCLPHTGALAAFGEGLGGGLALVTAALLGDRVSLLACHNPLPADLPAVCAAGAQADFYAGIRTHFRTADPTHAQEEAFLQALSYLDLVHFAPMVRARVLMGTCGMDAVSPPAAQDAVYAALACPKRRLYYAKHIHERVNDFEDELLCFLHTVYE